jgi:molecular chaperone GrpE (heat shock protein)
VDQVTCYFRHKLMNDVFTKAGVEVTKENRKEIDRIIHSIVGVEYKNCSATWKAIKEQLAENEEAFVEKLRKVL